VNLFIQYCRQNKVTSSVYTQINGTVRVTAPRDNDVMFPPAANVSLYISILQ
jgi:hypothetical protein